MTQSDDSTRHLAWFRPTVFLSKLLLVEQDNPRNKIVAEVYHKDGSIRFVVRTTANMDDELIWREMCKTEVERMKEMIAFHIAKKLN